MSLKTNPYNESFSQVLEFSRNNKNNFILNDTNIKLIKYGIPFVIRNLFPEKLREDLQDLHLLSKRVTNVQLPVESYNNPHYDATGLLTKQLTFKEYVEYLFSPNTKDNLYLVLDLHNNRKKNKYRTVKNEKGSILQLLNDLISNDEILNKKLFYYNTIERRVLFLGKDTITQTHYHDRQEAMFHQVTGTKRVYLFPPYKHLFHQMKPCPWYSKKMELGDAMFKYENFSEFEKVTAQQALKNGLEATLEPGDSLYIPIYWWHTVFGENVNMSVSDFFSPSFCKKYILPLEIRTRMLLSRL